MFTPPLIGIPTYTIVFRSRISQLLFNPFIYCSSRSFIRWLFLEIYLRSDSDWQPISVIKFSFKPMRMKRVPKNQGDNGNDSKAFPFPFFSFCFSFFHGKVESTKIRRIGRRWRKLIRNRESKPRGFSFSFFLSFPSFCHLCFPFLLSFFIFLLRGGGFVCFVFFSCFLFPLLRIRSWSNPSSFSSLHYRI